MFEFSSTAFLAKSKSFFEQKSPGGIISVRFKEPESAEACIKVSITSLSDQLTSNALTNPPPLPIPAYGQAILRWQANRC
jgi:hypothetical protein